MLIAGSVAAVVAASALAAGTPAPVNPAPPPIVVNITAATNVSASLVAMLIAETEAVFRSAGVSFIWRRGERSATSLSVEIGNDVGAAPRDETPLGWITFEDGRPDQLIYLSYANAAHYLEESSAVVGIPRSMTRVERDLLLARALGRALAHELGHYLLGTKTHTPKGLLKAVRTAYEFFAPDHRRFELEPAQQTEIAARLQGDPIVASRQTTAGGRRSPGTSQ